MMTHNLKLFSIKNKEFPPFETPVYAFYSTTKQWYKVCLTKSYVWIDADANYFGFADGFNYWCQLPTTFNTLDKP